MKIIDIEERAQEIVRDAKEADKNLEADVERETQKLQSDIKRKALAKGDTIRSIEDEEAEKRIKEIREQSEKNIAALKQKYNANKDKWVDTIVSNIIEG